VRGQVFRYEGLPSTASGAADLPVLAGTGGVRGAGDARARAGWTLPRAGGRAPRLPARGRLLLQDRRAPVIDLGDTALTERSLRSLARVLPLGAWASTRTGNTLDSADSPSAPVPPRSRWMCRWCRCCDTNGTFIRLPPAPAASGASGTPPRLPRTCGAHSFGRRIDSIVTVEPCGQRTADIALSWSNRPGDRFAAIERPAAVSGLEILRAGGRSTRSCSARKSSASLNGHVPVTGSISAIAVLAAVLNDRNAVGDVQRVSPRAGPSSTNGQQVNHQWSKSRGVRGELPRALKAPLYSCGNVPWYCEFGEP